jgi:hypothetical protein
MHLHASALALAIALRSAAPAHAGEAPSKLTFDHLFVSGPAGARVAPEVEALAGHRVSIVGHMVHMEEPLRAAFYLAPRPVEADESGGGTGDLPPQSVRVEVPGLVKIPWVAGPVEVEGLLQVGRAEDADGRVSWLRVLVEKPAAGSETRKVPSRSRDGVSKPSNTQGGHK